jgi:hypothetical protein
MTVENSPSYVSYSLRVRRKRDADPPFNLHEDQYIVDQKTAFTLSGNRDTYKNLPGWRRSLGVSDVGLGYSLLKHKFHFRPDVAFDTYRLLPTDPYGPGVGTLFLQGLISTVTGVEVNPTTISSSNADVQAKGKAIASVKDICNAFQGGTFLGELRETISMIRRPALALRQGIDSYYRRAKKLSQSGKINTVNKAIAGSWLEYQYGWRPLISDLEGACKTASGLGKHFVTNRFSGTASTSTGQVVLRSYTVPSHGATWGWEIHQESESQVSYSGSVRAGNENSAPGLSHTWGLSTRDFLPTVWELIPYSFLVDYFSNVGSIIDCLSYCSGNIAWVSKSVKRRSNCIAKGLKLNIPEHDTIYSSTIPGHSSLEWTSFSRNILVPSLSALMPPLAFKLPGSSTKFLNIGALASMRIATTRFSR